MSLFDQKTGSDYFKCADFLATAKQEDDGSVEVVLVNSILFLGGADWLQRRAGGGAAFLSGQQDTADAKASFSSCCCCPLLDGGDGVGDIFIVESFDTIIEVVYLHLLHLKMKTDCNCD